MGHYVSGIIAKKSDAAKIADKIPLKQFFDLSKDFVIFPVDDDLLDKYMNAPHNFDCEQFTYLSSELSNFLLQTSVYAPIVYIETEYFGGDGCQSAIAFSGGEVVFGPMKADIGPINEALKRIGVSVTDGFVDEFEAVGLANIRSCDEFFE